MKKKWIAVLLIMAMLFSLAPVSAFAGNSGPELVDPDVRPGRDPVAQIGNETFTSLEKALESAEEGDDIYLLKDVELTDPIEEGSNYNLLVNKSVNIYGQNHTIKNGLPRGIAVTGENVGFYDMKIMNACDYGRGIDTRGDIDTLKLKDVNIILEGNKNNQAITIGGNQSSKAKVINLRRKGAVQKPLPYPR